MSLVTFICPGWVWDVDDEGQEGQADPAADGPDGEAEAAGGRSSGSFFQFYHRAQRAIHCETGPILIAFTQQRMMGEMETQRVEEQENYWLIQYQKLLDSKPKGLEEAEGSMDLKVTTQTSDRHIDWKICDLKFIFDIWSLTNIIH